MRHENLIRPVITGLFFLIFFLSFINIKIYNPDLWWHLAQGRYIVETRSLPEGDPFSYTSLKEASDRKSIILKGYWLSEVIFYFSYKLLGPAGIIFVRSILLLLFLFFIFCTLRLTGLSLIIRLILIYLIYNTALNFAGERPQLFTFAIFSAILYILESFRLKNTKAIYLVPGLVLLSSNMHPGFVVSLLLLTVYLLGTIIEYLWKKEGKEKLKTIIIVMCLTIIASAFNPNNLKVFGELFHTPLYTSGIVEFSSPVFLYLKKISPINYPYIIFIVINLLGIKFIIKSPTSLIAFGVFLAMSLIAIRFVIFYMAVGGVIAGFIFMEYSRKSFMEGFLSFLKRREHIIYAITLAAVMFWFLKSVTSQQDYEFKVDIMVTPVAAADFISGNNIDGNLFNEYGFGGYLIWRLYPDKKVFIDGRALEGPVLKEYEKVISADSSWTAIFGKYDITCVVMPPLLPHGGIYPIVERLFDDLEWDLIYNDHLSLIFLKRDGRNESIRKKYLKKKEEGLQTIILQASAGALRNVSNPYYLISLGKTFYRLGKIDDAKKAFLIAYQRDPNNPLTMEWLNKIEQRQNKPLLNF